MDLNYRFDNDYHRDLFYHGLCEQIVEEFRFIGSEKTETVTLYYGYAKEFINSGQVGIYYGYTIRNGIRNIFIPE